MWELKKFSSCIESIDVFLLFFSIYIFYLPSGYLVENKSIDLDCYKLLITACLQNLIPIWHDMPPPQYRCYIGYDPITLSTANHQCNHLVALWFCLRKPSHGAMVIAIASKYDQQCVSQTITAIFYCLFFCLSSIRSSLWFKMKT